MLDFVLADTPSEEWARTDRESMGGGGWDATPELGVERSFYQQDINSECNPSARLLLHSLKGTGSEIGAHYRMLHAGGLPRRNSCFLHQVQLRCFPVLRPRFHIEGIRE